MPIGDDTIGGGPIAGDGQILVPPTPTPALSFIHYTCPGNALDFFSSQKQIDFTAADNRLDFTALEGE